VSWSHAYDIAFEVIAEGEQPTFEEWLKGLRDRANQPEAELRDCFDCDVPFDSDEITEDGR
jgi:hypothetical protein